MARAVRRKSASTPMKKGVKHAIKKPKATKKTSGTVWPRSSDPFYIGTYFMKWVTTSWTDGSWKF